MLLFPLTKFLRTPMLITSPEFDPFFVSSSGFSLPTIPICVQIPISGLLHYILLFLWGRIGILILFRNFLQNNVTGTFLSAHYCQLPTAIVIYLSFGCISRILWQHFIVASLLSLKTVEYAASMKVLVRCLSDGTTSQFILDSSIYVCIYFISLQVYRIPVWSFCYYDPPV